MDEQVVVNGGHGRDDGALNLQSSVSAGGWLRSARERAGVHIGALAVALKVPVAKLEALEADRLDLLPDAVFARALASSICRALKLDASEVLRLLPGSATPSLEFAARPAAATVPTRLSDPGKMRLSRVSRPVVVGVMLLVLAALVLLAYPAFVDTVGEAEEAVMPIAVPEGAAAPQGPVPGPVTGLAPAPAPAEPALPAATLASSPAPAMAPAAAGLPPITIPTAASSAGDTLRVTARGASWVQVTDASGATPLRRTLAEGESVTVTGMLPLSVVVGRVDSVEVQVRGAPFDMAPVARNNIARFQVR